MPPKSAILAALLVVTALAASGSASATPTCELVASPSGSDAAAGTVTAPFQTAQKLVDSLQPGQTGCLRAGTYEEDVTMRHGGTAGAPIVIRSYPGEIATLVGRLRLAPGADYTTVSDMTLVGLEHGHECSKMCASPTVDADHTTFVRDDVTNEHADTICFLLGDSGGVYGTANYTTIEDDRIHDCGALPATNYDHGIYAEETYGSQIVDNLIYDNADRGIQLYPQAIATLIRGNVIDGNGEGVDFGASGQQSSNDNLVENNIISNSNVLYNVLSAYGPGDTPGTGNVVEDNCIGGGAYDNQANPGGIRFDHTGFTLAGNILAVPSFFNRAHGDFSLAPNSPCRAITDGGTGGGGGAPTGTNGATVPGQRVVVTGHAAGGPANSRSRSRPKTPVTIVVRWVSVRGRRRLRLRGRLKLKASKWRAAGGRCPVERLVLVKALREHRWTTVSQARTRHDCTFTSLGPAGGTGELRLEAVVIGVGRSNIVTIRTQNRPKS
jgi:hypothetical protein